MLTLTDVTLAGNGYGSDGTPIAVYGGGLSMNNGGVANPTNVTISRNWATSGGGLGQSTGAVTLTNVTIGGNDAMSGGGIYHDGGNLTLVNVRPSVTGQLWWPMASPAPRHSDADAGVVAGSAPPADRAVRAGSAAG